MEANQRRLCAGAKLAPRGFFGIEVDCEDRYVPEPRRREEFPDGRFLRFADRAPSRMNENNSGRLLLLERGKTRGLEVAEAARLGRRSRDRQGRKDNLGNSHRISPLYQGHAASVGGDTGGAATSLSRGACRTHNSRVIGLRLHQLFCAAPEVPALRLARG